jgi:hypothetical protein
MNSIILDRYDITSDNRFIIDVSIPGPEELFEKYDENASFYKKDLNARFEEYLLECVEEIGLKNNFIIRIRVPEDQARKTDEGDIIFSFKQYFEYCISSCQKEIKTISFRMLLHLGFAISALFLMMILSVANTTAATGFFSRVTSGLPAAIWVLLLIGFSRFLFRLMTQRSQIKMYSALKNTPVEFVYNGVQI